ncbi:MAG: hypothetical protein JSR59_19515 [Proteobacteria bacterium]|nr:hypothetical protein [Pseudomonadota bacterium]
MIYNSTLAWTGLASSSGSLTQTSKGTATAGDATGGTAGMGRAGAMLTAATQAALDKSAHGFKATRAAQSLARDATTLGSDLQSALHAAGVSLDGSVEFSLDAKGALQISGSDHDKAAVSSFLQGGSGGAADLRNRLVRLTTSAGQLSQQIRQGAAASQAARYAGSSGNVMSLYSTFLQQQNATPAAFTLSATSASLSYAGMLKAQA